MNNAERWRYDRERERGFGGQQGEGRGRRARGYEGSEGRSAWRTPDREDDHEQGYGYDREASGQRRFGQGGPRYEERSRREPAFFESYENDLDDRGPYFARQGRGSQRDWPDESESGIYGSHFRESDFGRESFGAGRGFGQQRYGSRERSGSQGFGSSGRFGGDEPWRNQGPHTGRGPKGYRRSDEKLTEEICQRLEQHGDVDASEIEVRCQDGVVTLTGKVDDRETKRLAEECAEGIYGVRDVMNQLQVERGLFGRERGDGSEQGRSDTSSSSTRAAKQKSS